MEDQIEDGSINFRKYEMILRNVFRFVILMSTLFFLPNVFISSVKLGDLWYYEIILFAILLFFYVLFIFSYCKLVRLLDKLHKFEYEKNIMYMRIIVVYVLFAKLFIVIMYKIHFDRYVDNKTVYTVANVSKTSKFNLYFEFGI